MGPNDDAVDAYRNLLLQIMKSQKSGVTQLMQQLFFFNEITVAGGDLSNITQENVNYTIDPCVDWHFESRRCTLAIFQSI
jgi:hypothetical protein